MLLALVNDFGGFPGTRHFPAGHLAIPIFAGIFLGSADN